MQEQNYEEYKELMLETFNIFNFPNIFNGKVDNLFLNFKGLIKKINWNKEKSLWKSKNDKNDFIKEYHQYINSLNDFIVNAIWLFKIANFPIYNNYSNLNNELNCIKEYLNNKSYKKHNIVNVDYPLVELNENIFLSPTKMSEKNFINIKQLTLNPYKKDTKLTHKYYVEEGVVLNFCEKILKLNNLLNKNNKKEIYEELKDCEHEIKKIINNLITVVEYNKHLVINTNRDTFNKIISKINNLENLFGLKLILTSNICVKLSEDDVLLLKNKDILDETKFIKYLNALSVQGTILKNSDENIKSFMHKYPIICAPYMYKDVIACCVNYENLKIDESAGIIMSENINKTHTVLAHEVEHLKDAYFIRKTKENLKNKSTLSQFMGENSYVSELYIKNLVQLLTKKRTLSSYLEDGVLKNIIDLTTKKQNLYFFDNEVIDINNIVFNDISYEHLKDKINNNIVSIIILSLLSANDENNDDSKLRDILKIDNNLPNIINISKNLLKNMNIADLIIHEISSTKDKKIDLSYPQWVPENNVVGKIGDEDSKSLFFKGLAQIINEIANTFSYLNGSSIFGDIPKNKIIEESQYIFNEILGLKNSLILKRIISEYENIKIPKYYMALNEEGQLITVININEQYLSNNIKRVFESNLDKEEEYEGYVSYLLSPIEIYARNTEAYISRNFINKTNKFVNAANQIVLEKVVNNLVKTFSSAEVLEKKNKNKKEYFERVFNSHNLLLEEISENNLSSWKKINKELNSLLLKSDNFVFKLIDNEILKKYSMINDLQKMKKKNSKKHC